MAGNGKSEYPKGDEQHSYGSAAHKISEQMVRGFRWLWCGLRCAWSPITHFMADIVSPIVIAFATAAILYVSIGQWEAFRGQMNALRGQLGEMKHASEQVEKAITATNRQADAAERANEIANAGILASDRPWVGVDFVQTPPVEPNKDFPAKVIVKNSGRSPAISLHGTVRIHILPDIDPLPELPDECIGCAESVLFPNGALSFDITVGAALITQEKVDRIKNGTDLIFFDGRFDYLDAAQRPHKTFVCSVYMVKSAGFVGCASGNHAD